MKHLKGLIFIVADIVYFSVHTTNCLSSRKHCSAWLLRCWLGGCVQIQLIFGNRVKFVDNNSKTVSRKFWHTQKELLVETRLQLTHW